MSFLENLEQSKTFRAKLGGQPLRWKQGSIYRRVKEIS